MSQALTNEVEKLRKQVIYLSTQVRDLRDEFERMRYTLDTEYQRKRGRKANGEHEAAL